MTEYKTYKQYFLKSSPKLKKPTPTQQAFSAFIQKITNQGLKGQAFRTARENFLSSTFSSSGDYDILAEQTRIESKHDLFHETRGY